LPRKTDSSRPGDWLEFAAEDIASVRQLAGQEIAYRVCCGKLAEAVEKIFKAELIRLGWPLVRTHNLPLLAQELARRGSVAAGSAQALAVEWDGRYLADRYPGFDLDDPDWLWLHSQIAVVDQIFHQVRNNLP
jgi:HEPN domain-containing protein